MIVCFPWPDKGLSPNARLHRMAKAKLVREARLRAFYVAKAAMPFGINWPETCHLDITFHPPDRRRRDLDNMLASAKSCVDGLADAMKVDDYGFSLTLRRGDPVKGGAVVVTICK
jgi:crossover junction endodeoxyribonuclease RusA